MNVFIFSSLLNIILSVGQFFPSTVKDWFNLNASVRNSESLAIFKSRLLSFIRPIQSNVCNIFDPIGLKLLTRLRSGYSRLNEHKYRHNFQDCLNPLCSCTLEIEGTVHYFLHCHHFSEYRSSHQRCSM